VKLADKCFVRGDAHSLGGGRNTWLYLFCSNLLQNISAIQARFCRLLKISPLDTAGTVFGIEVQGAFIGKIESSPDEEMKSGFG